MVEIHLVSVGLVDPSILQWLKLTLGEILRMRCVISDLIIDPVDTYHAGRQQYHSTQILERLAALNTGSQKKILGVATVDLFIPILTFVFGEAEVGRRAVIFSLHRLRQSFYGLPEDSRLFYERCEKEAIHELGHTFGLIHCHKFDCVMHFSNSIEQVDLKSNLFCEECSESLEAGGALGAISDKQTP